jgi:hypothetical protein
MPGGMPGGMPGFGGGMAGGKFGGMGGGPGGMTRRGGGPGGMGSEDRGFGGRRGGPGGIGGEGLATMSPDTKLIPHERTEFVILFVWREPTPSDALRGIEGDSGSPSPAPTTTAPPLGGSAPPKGEK